MLYPMPTPSLTPAVYVQALDKTYQQRFSKQHVHALRDLTLRVEQGTVFGLLGPNGAGKTTLVKILLSIVHATSGEAQVLGQSVRTPEARRRIGFLPENHRFPEYLTAGQALDLYGQLAGVAPDVRRRRTDELLERVRMGKWKDTRISKFSKGMMQRLGLAQALINDPDLVFLDEPTDGVDPIGRREIRDLLVWMRDAGKTIFLNSHLLSEVEQVCSRIAILNEGRLVREGTIDELTAQQQTYTLVATAFPETLHTELKPVLAATTPVNETLFRYMLELRDRPALNQTLDRLRAYAVEIESIQPARKTLEDYFIDVIQDQ